MEREVGGGIGMGKTCKPKAVSFQCMTKFTTNKKKKKSIYIKGHLKQNSTSKFEDQIGFIQQFVKLEVSHLANKKKSSKEPYRMESFYR